MRVLLDESLPEPLAGLLTGHAVRTVAGMKWQRLANGELLRRAAADFDVVLTADQNIEFQQNLKTLPSQSSCSLPRATDLSRLRR